MPFRWLMLLAVFAALSGGTARADPFDPSQYSAVQALFSSETAKDFVNAAGSFAAHREYEGASTGGGKVGLDLGLETTLVRLPDELIKDLVAAGIANASDFPNSIPIARVHVRKSLGPQTEISFSGIIFKNIRIFGGGIKFVLYAPSEGSAWAIRASYAHAQLGFVETSSYHPELVVSQPLEFVDPYLSAGLLVSSGTLSINDIVVSGTKVSYTASNSSAALTAALGISMHLVDTLQIALEGGYHSLGAHHLGIRVGLSL